MYGMLEETRSALEGELLQQWETVVKFHKPGKGKISKGDNYQQLPYLVLDYPAIFNQKEGVLAIRTMFWWGNGFSMTLHVNGELLQRYRDALMNNLEKMRLLDGYFGINEDQWQHHYEESNYCETKDLNREMLEKCFNKGFLKLSLRLPVEEHRSLIAWSAKNAKVLLSLFN